MSFRIIITLFIVFALKLSEQRSIAQEWIVAGTVAGAGIAAWHYDENIQWFVRENNYQAIENIGKYALEPLTGGIATMPLLAGAYYYGYKKENSVITEFAVDGAKAFIIARTISYIPKYLLHRERPESQENLNKNAWHGPSFKSDHTSFPSGHAASAFALATIAAYKFNEYRWVAPFSYSLAGLASFSRVYRDKHWMSDILAGCIIGLLTGSLINNLPEKFVIIPSASDTTAGISLIYVVR